MKKKIKGRILKATREKQQIIYKAISIRLSPNFSAETLQARREWHNIFKVIKGKTYDQEYSTQQSSHSDSFFINLFYFIYLLAVLGLHCCARVFSHCGELGLLFIALHGLLIVVASLVVERGL